MLKERAGVLGRVSLDRDEDSRSPDEQVEDGCHLAAARGCEVVETYLERDVSGYKDDVPRPQYDRLIADCYARRIDVVIVWKVDRLTRKGVFGIVEFMQVMRDTGVKLLSVTEPFIDTSTPIGEGILAMVASLAKQESYNTSLRVKRHQRKNAERGKRHLGGTRTYGFACPGKRKDEDGRVVCDVPGCPHDGTSVIEAEAAVVQEAARRILDGESLRSICFDLNAREVRTSAAGAVRKVRGAKPDPATGRQPTYTVKGEWQPPSLSSLLRNPVIAGEVRYNGETFNGDGWVGILTKDEYERVLAALTSRPHTRISWKKGNRHLLTGRIRCSECGGRLKYMQMTSKTNGTVFPRYQCVKQPGYPHCGKVAVTMRGADEFVTQELLDFLATARLRPLEGYDDVPDLERQLVEAQQGLTDLVRDRYVRRIVSSGDFDVMRAELDAQVELLARRISAAQRAHQVRVRSIPLGDRAALQAWWDAADQEERRDAVHEVIGQVTISPAKVRPNGKRAGGNKFDTSRVKVDFNMTVFMKMAARATPTEADERADIETRFVEGIYAQGVEQLAKEEADRGR